MIKKINYIIFPALIIAICMTTASMYANACGTETIVEILSPTNKIYAENSIPLTFTVNKLTSWIGYSLNEQTNITITGNTTLSDLPDGEHSIIVYARDKYCRMGASNIVYFAVDTTPPDITDILQSPPVDNVTPDDEVQVNATVIDNLSGVRQVILYYYVYPNDNTSWISIEMINIEGNIWSATIPAFPQGTTVTYAIMAEDNVRNMGTTVEKGYVCRYPIIPEFTSLIPLAIFMTATLATTIAYKRKRFSNK